MKIEVINTKGEKTGRAFELAADVFASKASDKTLRQAIHVHLTNTRTGTAKAKNRGEVSGTGKKPWANNKIEQARTGDKRTPIFRGGGVSHGPVPMNYSLKMPSKMKKTALYKALSVSAEKNKIYVIEDFEIKGDRPTHSAWQIIQQIQKKLDANMQNITLYFSASDENFVRAFRNLKGIKALNFAHMNPYDIISSSHVLVFESAMEKLNGSKAEKGAEKAAVKAVKKTTKSAKK